MRDESCTGICGTLAAIDHQGMKEAANAALSQGADLLEIRLDHLEVVSSTRDFDWIRDLEAPVIATHRYRADGGKYEGPEDKHLRTLKDFSSICDLVDLELGHAGSGLMDESKENGSEVILSIHNFKGTPSRKELLNTVSQARSYGAAYAKIATLTHSKNEVLRVISIPTIKNRVIAIPMGSIGRVGRLLAPFFGSQFAYAYPEGAKPVAPGMLSIPQMKDIHQQILNLSEKET